MVLMEAGLHGVGTGEMKQEVKQRERESSVTTRKMLEIVMASVCGFVCLFI